MSEPTLIERAEQAVTKAFGRMMYNLQRDDVQLSRRNYTALKKAKEDREFAEFQAQAEAEREAEAARLRALSRVRSQRESATAKIMEARPWLEKIERNIASLGDAWENLQLLADSAYAAAPADEKPNVSHAYFKNGALESALLVALQRAGIRVLKEVDALRGQAELRQVFESGARQIIKADHDERNFN